MPLAGIFFIPIGPFHRGDVDVRLILSLRGLFGNWDPEGTQNFDWCLPLIDSVF